MYYCIVLYYTKALTLSLDFQRFWELQAKSYFSVHPSTGVSLQIYQTSVIGVSYEHLCGELTKWGNMQIIEPITKEH